MMPKLMESAANTLNAYRSVSSLSSVRSNSSSRLVPASTAKSDVVISLVLFPRERHPHAVLQALVEPEQRVAPRVVLETPLMTELEQAIRELGSADLEDACAPLVPHLVVSGIVGGHDVSDDLAPAVEFAELDRLPRPGRLRRGHHHLHQTRRDRVGFEGDANDVATD